MCLMSICVHTHTYHVHACIWEDLKKVSDPLEVGLQGIVGCLMVLGTERKSSERSVNFLTCRAISLTHKFLYFIFYNFLYTYLLIFFISDVNINFNQGLFLAVYWTRDFGLQNIGHQHLSDMEEFNNRLFFSRKADYFWQHNDEHKMNYWGLLCFMEVHLVQWTYVQFIWSQSLWWERRGETHICSFANKGHVEFALFIAMSHMWLFVSL